MADPNILRKCTEFLTMNFADEEEPFDSDQVPDRHERIIANLQAKSVSIRVEKYQDYDIVYRGNERIIAFLYNQIILCYTKDAIEILEIDGEHSSLLEHLNIDCDEVYEIIQGKIDAFIAPSVS